MVDAIFRDVEIASFAMRDETFDIGEHHLILIAHMAAHLHHIIIIIFQDEECDVGQFGAIDCLDKFAAYQWKIEIEEICVRFLRYFISEGRETGVAARR